MLIANTPVELCANEVFALLVIEAYVYTFIRILRFKPSAYNAKSSNRFSFQIEIHMQGAYQQFKILMYHSIIELSRATP